MRSRPARARGLKQIDIPHKSPNFRSRPARARGLKLENCNFDEARLDVAPRAGAWIETT